MCFLGQIVSKEGVRVYLKKLRAIKNCARLINMTEICSFMGLASYYFQFVKGYAAITSYMIYMTQKEVLFKRDGKCEKIFK